MTTTEKGPNQANPTPPYPNIPLLLESKASEYGDGGVTSTISILGHPVHPIIVIFPVAFLTGAAGADVAYWLTQDPFWARAAFWLIGLGGAAGVLAALVGVSDFIRIGRTRKRSAGWAHMFANVAALILTSVNLSLRWGDFTQAVLPTGLIISLVVATLLGIGGWFGGELTFRHKVGVVGPSSRDAHL